MLNSQDLRFIGSSGDVVPQRAEVIISQLQQHFIQQTVNGCNRLMIRFRSKGGQMDSVRMSMNSDVIDIFTTCQVKDLILKTLEEGQGFDIEFVESPYCFYLIKWEPNKQNESIEFLDSRNQYRILSVNTKYVCDTSDKPYTLRMPQNAIDNDYVIIQDRFGTFNTNNLGIDGNGQSILGGQSINLDVNHIVAKFVYVQSHNKWVMI